VVGDEAQLVQLFQNLLANAIKFHGDERPQIDVGGEIVGGEAVVRVRDNGVGIDPAQADRVFMMFQRLEQIQRSGTGIGLALCKRIVERHEGRIWVESEPGSGSTFYVALPVGERRDRDG
jgi:chemotaxis family two-component system sensor kinase Cph1